MLDVFQIVLSNQSWLFIRAINYMFINNFNRETYDQPGSRWLGREVFYCNGTNTLKKPKHPKLFFELNFPVHNCICWCN